jgi:trigger factor
MEISSTIEDLTPVLKKIQVTVPGDIISSRIEEGLQQMAKTAKMKGFRPGKAPRHLVEKLYRPSVKNDVVNKLISESLYDVIRTNSLSVVGRPQITVDQQEDNGEGLSYQAEVQLFPNPEITGYDSFDVTVSKRQITDEMLDAELEKLREARATVQPLQFRNTAQEGDIVNCTLSIKVEGDEASQPEPLSFLIGEKKLPEVVEQAAIGKEIGVLFEQVVEIREDHPVERLRGNTALYSMTIESLSERILPELNDDLAAELKELAGKPIATLLDLRMVTRELLEAQAEREAQSEISAKVLEKLIEQNEFVVPQVLIDDEIRSLLVRYGLVNPQEVNPESIDVTQFRNNFSEIAEKRVKSAVVVDRIAAQEKIELEEEDVKKGIADLAAQNRVSVEEVQRFFAQSSDSAKSFSVELLREKIVELLRSKATVSYEELQEEPAS